MLDYVRFISKYDIQITSVVYGMNYNTKTSEAYHRNMERCTNLKIALIRLCKKSIKNSYNSCFQNDKYESF